MKKREINHILGTIFAIIDKQKALRRDGFYNIEIILETEVSGVHLHSTIMFWHTQMFQSYRLMLYVPQQSFEMELSKGQYSEVVIHV